VRQVTAGNQKPVVRDPIRVVPKAWLGLVRLSILLLWLVLILVAPISALAARNYPDIKSFRDCPECPEMISIPAGNFQMGMLQAEVDSTRKQIDTLARWFGLDPGHAQPQHIVTIAHPFAVGKYPVTRGEFARFVKETGFEERAPCLTLIAKNKLRLAPGADWAHPGFPQADNEPVVCVTWSDAHAYVDWLNRKVQGSQAGRAVESYRLPSEAEWEYLARAGTTTVRWWGDEIGANKAVCRGCRSPWDGQQPAPVGLYGANAFGVFDPLGNVDELVEDCWNKNYEGAPSDGSAWLAGTCDSHVTRGGSWSSPPWAVTSAFRASQRNRNSDYAVGFRIAGTLSQTAGNK